MPVSGWQVDRKLLDAKPLIIRINNNKIKIFTKMKKITIFLYLCTYQSS
jgi:hypothetical protein